jgi:hypothetical protein
VVRDEERERKESVEGVDGLVFGAWFWLWL